MCPLYRKSAAFFVVASFVAFAAAAAFVVAAMVAATILPLAPVALAPHLALVLPSAPAELGWQPSARPVPALALRVLGLAASLTDWTTSETSPRCSSSLGPSSTFRFSMREQGRGWGTYLGAQLSCLPGEESPPSPPKCNTGTRLSTILNRCNYVTLLLCATKESRRSKVTMAEVSL